MLGQIYDISMPIYPGMSVYKNKPEKQPEIEASEKSSPVYIKESRLHLDAHTGTHIDAPSHVVPGGASIDSIALERLIGKCKVLDLTGTPGGINQVDLNGENIGKNDFILLKTKNSFAKEFEFDFVYLSEQGAKYLAGLGIRGVGIDALGIERDQPGYPTHRILFDARIVILEGLRLKDVEPGEYWLAALPMSLTDTEASPVRAVLIKT